MKRYFNLILLLVALSLAAVTLDGCGPSIDCDNKVDGISLLKSLSNPSTSLESAADNVLQLASVCRPKKEQQELIDKTTERIALEGSAKLQANFYGKMSELIPNSQLRQDFIAHSSFINSKAPSNQFHLVDFNQLGKIYDTKLAPQPLMAEFKELGLDQSDPLLIRQIEVEGGTLVLARTTNSEGFNEDSRIRFFDANSNRLIVVPKENLGYLSDDSLQSEDDKSFGDHFFACLDLAGDNCAVRDSRFVLDQNNRLRYIVSLRYGDLLDGSCGVDRVVTRVNSTLIERDDKLSDKRQFSCNQSPTPSAHLVDLFDSYSIQQILSKLNIASSDSSPASLVNFKARDASDNQLKTRLLSLGYRNDLLERAVEPMDVTSVETAKSIDASYSAVSKLVSVAEANVASLKWLLSNPTIDTELATQLSSLDDSIRMLSTRLNTFKVHVQPQEPPKPLYPYEQVSIAIVREAQDSDTAIVRMPDTPYVYIGYVYPSYPPKNVILYSQKSLTDRPTIVNILARRGEKPMQYMINGFSQDVWSYATLSDEDMVEYRDYENQMQEYQKQLTEYNTSRANASAEILAFTTDLRNLNDAFRKIVDNSEIK